MYFLFLYDVSDLLVEDCDGVRSAKDIEDGIMPGVVVKIDIDVSTRYGLRSWGHPEPPSPSIRCGQPCKYGSNG